MARDTIFRSETSRSSDFEFDATVAEVFDDMVERSVPFYQEQQALIARLAREYWRPDTVAYDLGCATGTTLLRLTEQTPRGGGLIGYDNSRAMLDKARAKIDAAGRQREIELRHGDLDGDPALLSLERASFVCMGWTLQFVRPMRRLELVRRICRQMTDGGAFVLCEKVAAGDADLGSRFVEVYHEFKRSRGYTDGEIVRKREALENVLVPYRIDENVDLLRRAGFSVVETCFQWLNFAAFVCVKKPADEPDPTTRG
jgi:tRNA (cmo5U34)-methyltransferase